jgi:peptidoglycan hydrolase-like protein with peptidoglycan-binding domain
MSKSLATKNVAAVVLGLGLMLAFAFAFATPAKAQSVADLQAQINALLAQIAALQGGTSGGACFTFTRNHQQGDSGGEVMEIQKFLNRSGAQVAASGAGSPGNETAAFGPLTKAAVAKYQSMNGIAPAAGYWGPITRAKANSMCAPGPVTPGPGGVPTPSPSGPLQGGAGSIDTITAISGLSGEKVGEGEDDVEIAGVEVENSPDSDIRITAVTVDFGEGTIPGNTDLEDFITEVSIMLDGKQIANLDADEFNDDNDWQRTITLSGGGAFVSADDTVDLTVAVSGVNNIDSDDAGDDWGVDIVSFRFVDATGATITETVTYTEVLFDVNTFATASGFELKLSAGDDEINDARIIDVDDTDDTDGVEIYAFNLEADGSDVVLDDVPVGFATVGTANDPADMVNTVSLFADGVEIGTETVGGAGGGDDYQLVTFDDLDYTIDDGDKVEFVVKGDFNDTEAAIFVDGDTIQASTTVADIVADDETGELIANADTSGTAVSDAHAAYDVGIMVTNFSATESLTAGADGTADDDTVSMTLVFDVEAFDGTVYVSNLATPTTAADGAVTAIDVDDGGLLYRYAIDGTATVGLLADTVSKTDITGTVADDGTDEYAFEDGEKARITVSVTRSNATTHTDSDGFHQAFLVAIGWSATQDDDTMEVYEFNLDDYETDPIFAN